jgi:hypothetical protein
MPDNRTDVYDKSKISKLLVTAYPSSSSWYIAEFSSDNTDEIIGNFAQGTEMDKTVFFWQDVDYIGQDSPSAFWSGCYSAIAASNQALHAIEVLGNENGHQKGEALLTRAYNMFLLSNIFCKAYSPLTSDADLGLPYPITPETTVIPKYERGTVAELYKKIEQDITTGFPLIDDTQYEQPKYHFNKKAAAAFAARFYLYYGKNDKALYYADMVFPETNVASALRNWNTIAKENDFQTRGNNFIDATNPANLLITVHGSLWQRTHGPYSIGSKYCHNRYICQTETSESTGPWGASKDAFAYKAFSYTGGLPKYQMLKYWEYFEYTDVVAGIGYPNFVQVCFSTDEALLNRAEAKVLLKDYDGALADINTFLSVFADTTAGKTAPQLTRTRINDFYNNRYYYTPTEYLSPKKELHPDFNLETGEQENLIHCILQLRRILCLHEGIRWNDIKRYGIEIYRRKVDGNRITTYGEEFVLRKDDPRRALQIPKSVISAGLEPNPR